MIADSFAGNGGSRELENLYAFLLRQHIIISNSFLGMVLTPDGVFPTFPLQRRSRTMHHNGVEAFFRITSCHIY